jgi:hypothetical protein
MSVRLRSAGHRGSVIAVGYVVDAALVGAAEARRRVVALWTPAATVYAVGEQLVVTGVRAHRVRAALAAGAPIALQDGIATTAPLADDEAAALRDLLVPGAVVVARAGVAEVVAPAAAIDIAGWIDLDDAVELAAAPLAAPPARAAVPAAVDVRAALGIAAVSAEDAGLGASLRRALAGAASGDAGTGAAGTGAAAARGPSRWSRLLRWLADRVPATTAVAGPGGAASATGPAVSGTRTPRRASWWQRLRARLRGAATAAQRGLPPPADPVTGPPPPPTWRDRLRDRLLRALWTSRIGQTLSRRHAAYLRRMLELFDQGDLDAALRHAIPLGGDDTSPGGLSAAPPRPRASLDLPFTDAAGRRSHIPVSVDGTEMIRARYRAALARLEQLGRIEEAAFVLAELLGDVAGAVSLLERHQRFELAAKLAEGRQLAPGLVVRLWFLAGDSERAVAVARRHGAWADAIARLETSAGLHAARDLRLRWADALAAAGDLVQAVDVAWPLDDARPQVLGWIERGIAVGGSAGARLLVKKLAALPASFAEVAPALLAILDDRDDDAGWRRVALAGALVAQPTSPELRTIARPAVRALLADIGRGADGEAPALLPRLMRYADDAALRADQPVIPAGTRRVAMVDRDRALEHRWTAADAGVVPVRDLAQLPGGRTLLALGELGVRLLGRDGRTVAHFDQPASTLVASDHGASALAVIERGGVQRIARLDLAARRGAHWCDVELEHAARSFDGGSWLVSQGRDVLAIDATAARWKALWGITLDDGEAARGIARDGEWWAFRAVSPGASELWFYQGATLRRRQRRDGVVAADATSIPAAVALRPASQDWVEVTRGIAEPHEVQIALPAPGATIGLGQPTRLDVDNRVAAVVVGHGDGSTVLVVYLDAGGPRVVARLHLDAAYQVTTRFVDFTLAIGDETGRAIVLDLRTGALRLDLRIAP